MNYLYAKPQSNLDTLRQRFTGHHGPRTAQHHEREWLFFSFLLILILGYAAFAAVSWRMDFQGGVLANLLGILAMAVLGGLRLAGARLSPLITALQAVTLLQALCITWLTGGIYSATISWLALSTLPAILAYTQRARFIGLGMGWLMILGLYGYAWVGGEMALQIKPQDLIHWHLMMAIVIFGMQLALLIRLNNVRNERLQRAQQQRRQLRQLAKKLQNTQQQKDLFVASVSHELRTPMNAILGLADLIHHDKRLDDEMRSKIEVIQKSGEHLLTIVNDLLDHAQMQAGRLQVVQEPFYLHDTLSMGFQLLRRRAESKPLRYSLRTEPDLPPWVVGDSHRLTQILVNLLGNAIKFTSQGEIELHAAAKPDPTDPQRRCILKISVRDTGMGIPAELQHRVFASFSQADSSIARRFGGNGLGLSITRGLVDAMGGQIDLVSQEGVGSTFTVTLPCALSHAPQHGVPTGEAKNREQDGEQDGQQNSDHKVRILIADDNPLNRQIAALQLRRHLPQALITEVDNGLQAFAAVRDGAGFDVVLMDLLMPEMDGQTATRKIRSELPHPQCDTPIIALTANADRDELARCLEAGMNESMVKPFNRSLLVKRVLSYVA